MTTRKPAAPHVWDSHKHDAELHERIRELEAAYKNVEDECRSRTEELSDAHYNCRLYLARAEKAEAGWTECIAIEQTLRSRVAELTAALESVMKAYGHPGPLPSQLAQAFHAQHGAKTTCELCAASEREASK